MNASIAQTLLAFALLGTFSFANDAKLVEPVRPYVAKVIAAQDHLATDRREVLSNVASEIARCLNSDKDVNLVFICTHNSRRSQLSQVWCQVAAYYHGLSRVQTYSGGIEITACNIRTVRAMQRAGLSVVMPSKKANPVYLIQYAEDSLPIRAFSKLYSDQEPSPKNFIAMMCCSDADDQCPDVVGADKRFALHYEDPKSSDDTAQETSTYDERSFEIATEMFFLMSQVKQKLLTK